MNLIFQIVNAFIEDTCVIIVVAFLLARGKMLALMDQSKRSRRQIFYLGVVFGLIGLTETIFPGARYPYVANTLIVTFAAVTAGLAPALIAGCLIAVASLFFQPLQSVLNTLGTDVLSALVGAGVASICSSWRAPLRSFAAGIAAQASAILFLVQTARLRHVAYPLVHAFFSIPANGFGMLLLLLVVNDARLRAESERHRAEAEQSRALVSEAQLRALRSRVHPHFLFNALTSIAALCGIAPEKAEAAVLRLSQLMRRSLEYDLSKPLTLSDEMEYIAAYLEIEQHRFGSRLHIEHAVDPACAHILIPAFAMQTLVENAINHGVGPKIGQGHICIVAKRTRQNTLLAVMDDGIGIPAQVRKETKAGQREHGLQILTTQLVLLYGSHARLRLYQRKGGGTLAAFFIPTHNEKTITGGSRP